MLQSIVFYLFSAVLLASAVMVVVSRNSVHSVLFLILAFFNAAALFVLLGAEFIAFILVIVYVGAVAVLFLFVVMMLDINSQKLRQGFRRYLPIGITVGLILLVQLVFIASTWMFDPKGLIEPKNPAPDTVENTRQIGQMLYTIYFYPFQVSGLILLVAMIGAIVLTLLHKKDARRQKVGRQMDRKISDVIEVVKTTSGKGIDL